LIGDPSAFGRVAEDGTVYVRTSHGETAVGSYPGKTAEEALSYFVRKFEVLAAEVALLAARIKSGAMVPSDAYAAVKKLRDQVKELNGVGDLEALAASVEQIEPLIEGHREAYEAKKAAETAAKAARREQIIVEKFITGFDWVVHLPEEGIPSQYGIGAMLYGTIVLGIIALFFGLPISIGAALFLSYYAPEWLKKPMVLVIDVMAAIPSVVFGLWGFFILMPHAEYWAKLIHKYLSFIPFFDMPANAFSRSPFIAGLVLAIMIVPIVTSISREVFAQTPLDRIQAAYALGATKWTMIKSVVFPYGRGGIVGGAMLGLGRGAR